MMCSDGTASACINNIFHPDVRAVLSRKQIVNEKTDFYFGHAMHDINWICHIVIGVVICHFGFSKCFLTARKREADVF